MNSIELYVFSLSFIKESRENVQNIILKFGSFKYASQRVPLDVERFDAQLRQLVPNWSADDTNKFKNSKRANKLASVPTETNSVRKTETKVTPELSVSSAAKPKTVFSAHVKAYQKDNNNEAATTSEEEWIEVISDESTEEDEDSIHMPEFICLN